MPRLPSDPLHAVQTRFALKDTETPETWDEPGGHGGVPQVSHSPLDQETHVDPGRRRNRSYGFTISIRAVEALAPPGGAAGTHHGSWRSMWPWWSWRSTDLQGSKGADAGVSTVLKAELRA